MGASLFPENPQPRPYAGTRPFFIFLGRNVSALSQICLYRAAPVHQLMLNSDARAVAADDTISRAADVAGWGGFEDGYKCALIALLLRCMQICRSLPELPGADLPLWDRSRQGTAWVGPTGTSVCPRASWCRGSPVWPSFSSQLRCWLLLSLPRSLVSLLLPVLKCRSDLFPGRTEGCFGVRNAGKKWLKRRAGMFSHTVNGGGIQNTY